MWPRPANAWPYPTPGALNTVVTPHQHALVNPEHRHPRPPERVSVGAQKHGQSSHAASSRHSSGQIRPDPWNHPTQRPWKEEELGEGQTGKGHCPHVEDVTRHLINLDDSHYFPRKPRNRLRRPISHQGPPIMAHPIYSERFFDSQSARCRNFARESNCPSDDFSAR